MGYGAAGAGLLGGRFQIDPAIFQGAGEGDKLAKDFIKEFKNPEKFFEYHGENANIGATKENLTKEQLKERDKMGMLGKAIWDFINQRYVEHKNNIQQIKWDIANDGTFRVKAGASLGDINKFISNNNEAFRTMLANLQNPNARTAAAAERKITKTLSEFLGRVSIPSLGQLFTSSYNGLREIRNQHKELKGYIRKGEWNKVANFKVNEHIPWARAYVNSAKTLMKSSRVVDGKIVARKGRNNAVNKRLETLNKWRESGNRKNSALSLNRISSNISRLSEQMRVTSTRARGLGVPVSKQTADGIGTYKANLTQGIKNTVNKWRNQTGLRKLKVADVMSNIRKETQAIRKRRV